MQRDRHFPSYEEFSRYDSSVFLSDIVAKPWRRVNFLSLKRVKEMTWGQRILALIGLPAEANPGRLTRVPWMTYTVMALCCAISILAFYDAALFQKLAFYPALATRFKGLNFLSLFFVHGGWLHLLGNMYFFFIFGDNVEDRIGPWRFLALILGSTFLATAASFLLDGHMVQTTAHVGASGGVMGIMVYYLLTFPRAQFTYCLFFIFFRISASTLLLVNIVLQVSGALDQMGAQGTVGTDFLAHLGGALGGYLGFLYFEAHRSRRMARQFFESVS